MKISYKLKTGQINFENVDHPGAYICVVIKNGEFHNLQDDMRQVLIDALSPTGSVVIESESTNFENMFE